VGEGLVLDALAPRDRRAGVDGGAGLRAGEGAADEPALHVLAAQQRLERGVGDLGHDPSWVRAHVGARAPALQPEAEVTCRAARSLPWPRLAASAPLRSGLRRGASAQATRGGTMETTLL